MVVFTVMAVQLLSFTSSFFPKGKSRWLPLGYAALAAIIVMSFLGYIPRDIEVSGERLYPDYGPGILLMAVPLLVLAGRNLYVFRQSLKTLDNPVMYNQIISLRLGLVILTLFSVMTLLPWGKEYPISHFGNLILIFLM